MNPDAIDAHTYAFLPGPHNYGLGTEKESRLMLEVKKLKEEVSFLNQEVGVLSRANTTLKEKHVKMYQERSEVSQALMGACYYTYESLGQVIEDRKMELRRSRESVLEWQKAHTRAEEKAEKAMGYYNTLIDINKELRSTNEDINAKLANSRATNVALHKKNDGLKEQLVLLRDEANVAWSKCREWETKFDKLLLRYDNRVAQEQAASEGAFSLHCKTVNERERARAQVRELMKSGNFDRDAFRKKVFASLLSVCEIQEIMSDYHVRNGLATFRADCARAIAHNLLNRVRMAMG
jgi:chromosome segregation ATPase